MIAELAGAASGALAGMVVTTNLHEGSTSWARRLGRTRFRRANLPVGGVLFTILAATLTGDQAAAAAAAAGAMTMTAIGWRWVDPLPPVRDRG